MKKINRGKKNWSQRDGMQCTRWYAMNTAEVRDYLLNEKNKPGKKKKLKKTEKKTGLIEAGKMVCNNNGGMQ